MKTIPPPCPYPETGPNYWRSLDEVAATPEFREWVDKEFPAGASELADPVTRRNFVKIMASSFALAGLGLTGCRRPVENIVPFTRMPEDYYHGVARYYSTAMPTRGGAIPLVVKSHDGRPIKIEGNPDFPDGNGGTNTWAQASILSLYDVDRAKRFTRGGNTIPRETALEQLTQVSRRFSGNGGTGLAFLSEPDHSPSRRRLQDLIATKFPQAKWYSFDPVDSDAHDLAASRLAGSPVRVLYRFEQATIIVSLDCDFIGAEENNYRYIAGFAQGRRLQSNADSLNRLYVIEPLLSLTGMNADHRLRVAGSAVRTKAAQLANAVLRNTAANEKWIDECAADLLANKGKVLVIAGHQQPASVHALAHAMNEALGAIGKSVVFLEAPQRREGTLAELAQALAAEQVDTLVITGGNPVYSAPADLNWAATQRRAREIVRLGYHEDETFKVSDLHIPAAHYLETWSDARTSDGTYVPVQPLIEPLYGGLSEIEVLARIAGAEVTRGHDIARESFKVLASNSGENEWKQFLHDGFLKGTAAKPASVTLNQNGVTEALAAANQPAPSKDNLEVVFHRDYSMDDGRWNNNGWLQEMPDPVTKVTWENVILVSEATARELGFPREEFMFGSHQLLQRDYPRGVPVVRLAVSGKEVTGPLWIQPGLADHVVGIALGYGRTATGRIGKDSGFNAYALRTAAAPYYASGGKISRTDGLHQVSCTQHHWAMEGRPVVREANLSQYKQHPKFASALDLEHPPVVDSIYPNPLEIQKKNDRIPHQWGMTIDLNTCVSCQACVIACQSENNVPIVGKEQVYRQREMHWLRLDRYYTGNINDPQVVYQPMLCQHCEAAPCENVCPVNATAHDEEGLNVMVYNRCVGTRYCSNNCPYKVRRFNFFDYNKRTFKETTGPFYTTPLFKKTDGEYDMAKWVKNPDRHWREEEEWELLKLVKNPEVTVRMRGVMEKCSFCLQRIESAKIAQKVKAGASDNVTIPDGTIKTACQQACPAGAITFGNTKDPNSAVSKLKALDRNYQVLDYLYTRPRTTYLAKVRNPNPRMPDFQEYPLSTKEYKDAMGVTGDPYAHGDAGHGTAGEHHGEAETHGTAAKSAPHGAREQKGAH